MTTPESNAATEMSTISDYRWWIVVAFYVSAALVGVTSALSQNALVAYLGTLLMACTAAEWCLIDSSYRGKPMTWSVQFLVFVFWSLAVPLYLIVTRGWRGVGWLLLHVAGMYAIVFSTYYLTSRLFWGF
jgi:hypothetical protein